MRLIEMCIAYAAAGQPYGGASAGFAERDMRSTNANGGRDTAFSEVQADPGEDFDRAAEPEAHGVIIRAFLRMLGSDSTKSGVSPAIPRFNSCDPWIPALDIEQSPAVVF
jgi:hypothetical protein